MVPEDPPVCVQENHSLCLYHLNLLLLRTALPSLSDLRLPVELPHLALRHEEEAQVTYILLTCGYLKRGVTIRTSAQGLSQAGATF